MNTLPRAAIPFVWATRHASAVTAAFAVLTLAALLGLDYRIGHRWSDWIDRDDPAFATHERLVAAFGDPDTAILMFPRAALEGPARAGYFDFITTLRAAPGVVSVLEPAELFLDADAATAPDSEAVAALAARQAQGPLDFRAVLVSRAVDMLAPLVLLTPDEPALQEARLKDIQQAFVKLGIPLELAGTAVFSAALRQAIARDLARVSALLGLTACAVLALVFRDARVLAAVTVNVVVALALAFALTALAGLAITLLTLILVPLVFCFSLVSAIHLLTRTKPDGSWQLADAGERVLPPLLLATATSVAGCLVFAQAPQELVVRMGEVMAGAMAVSFLTTVTLLPALLQLCGRASRLPARQLTLPGRGVRRCAGAAVLIVTALCAFKLPALHQDPDAFNFFSDDAPLVRTWMRVEDAIAGLLVVDLMLESTDGARLDTPPHSAALAVFTARLREIPSVTTVVSGLELAKVPGGINALPPGLGEAFVRGDARLARMSVRLRNTTAGPWREISTRLHHAGRELASAGIALSVTGVIPLILEAQDRLLGMQSRALLAGLALTTLCAGLVLRNLWLGVALGVAVFLPLFLVGGVMAVLGIPLNAINVFVGSVVFGLVVDDALYLLYACRRGASLAAAAAEVDTALGVTSLTLGLAFGSLAFSSLVPLRQFGLLAAITIAAAWATHVGVLPWLPGLSARRGQHGGHA